MQQEKIPTVIIIGAGPGGLTLYHSLIKNKDKKEFNVKIFDRESSAKDRWQGYHIGLSSSGIRSLFNCISPSVALNLSKAIPNPIPDVEYHGYSVSDYMGNILFKPPTKQFKDIYEILEKPGRFTSMTYRDRLREVLLEDISVNWGKKFIGYEETEEGVLVNFEDGSQEFCDILVGADGINSPVRKQKIPELQIKDIGTNFVNTDVVVPKPLMDRLIKVRGNTLLQKTLGLNGDLTLIAFRLIPIDNYENKNNPDELHYRLSMAYFYSNELDNDKNFNVDDNNPESIIEYVKRMIRKSRPECEMTDVLLELWDLVPKETPSDPKNSPFKTYNPVQRRKVRDINPLSTNSWTNSRVTLIGDAAHAMSPLLGLGTNNAIQDAELLSKALLNYSLEKNYITCIKEYENEMIKRSSVDVLKSRDTTVNETSSTGYFGNIIRNSILKTIHIIMNVQEFVVNLMNHFNLGA